MFENMEFGYLSLLPIALVFIIAFTTRKVYIALVTGIISGIGILSFRDVSFSGNRHHSRTCI